jgi:tryptophan synthase beta chain
MEQANAINKISLEDIKVSERILLSQKEIPKKWYNVTADLPFALEQPISPRTGKSVTVEEMAMIFPPRLIEQEMTSERFIDIPEEVLNILSLYRPTPLVRARNLEKFLGTPARIFFKNESVSPAGSHKTNTAVPQAYYNKMSGVKRMSTETGAGQWGSALSFACRQFEMDLRIYMVKVSFTQKPYRAVFMRLFGADVVPSPSILTASGRAILEQDVDSPGSLGIAISEAVEEAASRKDTNYGLGSVLNHVLLHQTVIGIEARKQMDMVGDYPDYVIGCHGGGSNFGGIAVPFVKDVLEGKKTLLTAVEPASCPTLTKGSFAFDYGDTGKLTPIMKMYTLGHDFVPPAEHAGGLRYHGASPIISALVKNGIATADTVRQKEVFESAMIFARTEGIIPAPESAHAIAYVIKKAKELKEEGAAKTILFSLSGHGLFDMSAYDAYLNNTLADYEYPARDIQSSLRHLPRVN